MAHVIIDRDREAVFYAQERLWRGSCSSCGYKVSARSDRAIFETLRDHNAYILKTRATQTPSSARTSS